MKLTVKNLGPITKGGTIDLDKRFYVFVGKNGSGKTYLANLLYGVFDYYINHRGRAINLGKDYLGFTEEKTSFKMDKETFDFFKIDFFEKNIIHKTLNDFLLSDYPTLSNLNFTLEDLSYEKDFLKKELKYLIFDKEINVGYFFSKESNNSIISFTKESNEDVLTQLKNDHFYLSFRYGMPLKISEITIHFLNYFFINWLRNVNYQTTFLPADRASFLSLWKYIITTERSEKDFLYEKHSTQTLLTKDELKNFQPLYTKPVKDLINTLEQFDLKSTLEISTYKDLVQDLESLMGGKINVKEGKEGIARKRFVFEMQEKGEEIELFLASSSVNQLSLLYIYLKYWAKKENNFLIIDEPEISLHPENQVKLLNILMKFADMNDNRVLITTHSTLMADAVNNHVRIGHLQTTGSGKSWLNDHKDWLKENQLDINENITHEDFGVYYFDGAIKNYEVKDYGVFFKDFAEAEDKIKDAADILKGEIYNELHPKKAQ